VSVDDDPVVLVAIYPVRDFEHWRQLTLERIEGHAQPFGVRSFRIHRSVDDPNEVMVTMELRSRSDAEALIRNPDLRAWLDQAGAEAYPPFFVFRLEPSDVRQYAVPAS
jgi:hypothetical protein